jgi:hypothetical protein
MTKEQETIARIFGQTEGRCLTMFARSIEQAHQRGSSKWGVTLYYKDRVRLIVGGIVVCTLRIGRIWFALDKDYQSTNDYISLRDSGDWAETPWADYRIVPSISGNYLPSHRHESLVPHIERMHFSLIEKAADKYTKLREPCRKAHSCKFLKELRDRLNQPDLPTPGYQSTST